MEIIKINNWRYLSEKFIGDLREIYENSFPQNERREFEKLVLMENNFLFNFYYVINENILSGFYTIWTFTNFFYIEHFAIKEDLRNKGLGSELIKFITSNNKKLIVIEVERPGDPISDKRIKFYLKSGFSLCEFAYVQPPYSSDKISVPMNLMSYPLSLNYQEYFNIKETLYKEVYNYNNF